MTSESMHEDGIEAIWHSFHTKEGRAMSTIVTIAQDRSRSARLPDRQRSLVRTLVCYVIWVEAKLERKRTRRGLLELSDYQLKDIGLSRCDAEREARRRFWE
jgi:uncharacterized protein YjiS (DUF1127 family)